MGRIPRIDRMQCVFLAIRINRILEEDGESK